MKKFKDVDEYINAAAPEARPTLEGLRQFILKSIPKIEEKIWYGVPFYHLHGEVVGFAVYKKHVSFGIGPVVLTTLERKILEAAGYVTGKATIQIAFSQKIPTKILLKLLQAKVKLNQAQRP